MRLIDIITEEELIRFPINLVGYHGNDLTGISDRNNYTEKGWVDNYYNYTPGCIMRSNINARFCNNLKSLNGSPKEVTDFIFTDCERLSSLRGSPDKVLHFFGIDNCPIVDLTGITPDIESLNLENCGNFVSFKGIRKVSNLIINGCGNIKTLKHLWDADIKDAAINTFSTNDNEEQIAKAAVLLFNMKSTGEKNFFKLIKEARDQGLEDLFR